MRAILALSALLSAGGGSTLQAQVDYYARAGATFTTKLVRDVVFREIDVRQSLAPTLALGASLPIAAAYRVGLEGTLTTAGYHSTEAGANVSLGTVRTWSIVLGLEGPLSHDFRWRVGGGVIGYWPTNDRGIFLRGGGTRFLTGAGVDYRHSILPRWELMTSLRYDFHRFTTDELKARGFSQSQGVQRISFTIGLARGDR